MDIKKIIKKIVDNGRVQDMQELSNILEDTLEDLENYDLEHYKKYEKSLYEMAYGCVLDEEMAKDIVSKMSPYGEKWDMEQTEKMQEDYGLTCRPVDFYVVVNSAYNDYNDLFKDNVEMYIRFANDFINDEDAKDDKVYKYFTIIPR